MWYVVQKVLLLHCHRAFCEQHRSLSFQPVASFIAQQLVLTFGIAGVHQLLDVIGMLVVVLLVRKGVHGRAGAGAGAGGTPSLCC